MCVITRHPVQQQQLNRAESQTVSHRAINARWRLRAPQRRVGSSFAVFFFKVKVFFLHKTENVLTGNINTAVLQI